MLGPSHTAAAAGRRIPVVATQQLSGFALPFQFTDNPFSLQFEVL